MSSRDPLTPEERELARLLGGRLDKAPPAAVDAAVLAAARASVHAARVQEGAEPVVATAPLQERRQHPRRARWPALAGIAASVIFAVGLAWQMQPEPPQAPSLQEMATPAPAAPVDADAPAAAAPAVEYSPRSTAASRHAPVTDAAPVSPAVSAPKPAAPVKAPAPAPAPAQAAPSAKSGTADTPAPQAFRARAAEPSRPLQPAPAPPPAASAVLSAPAPAPAAAEAVGAFARTAPELRAPDRMDAASATAPPSPSLSAAAVQQEVEADARLTRRQWLQKIRHRRDAGDVDIARASLERYLAHYPETRLPRDLQPLLAD